jgi:hypothetical protein
MDLTGSAQNAALLFGIIGTGYCYRWRNDMAANIMICERIDASHPTDIIYQTSDHIPAGGKIWAQIKRHDSTSVDIYLYRDDAGSGSFTLVGGAPFNYARPLDASAYIGIRLGSAGQVDNFGGGALGVAGQAAAAGATASAVPATTLKSFSGAAAPAVATASSVAATSREAPKAAPGVATAGGVAAASRMAAATTFGAATASAVPAVGHTDIPDYPPIVPPTPPPPPPPPDPRDVPALDGPFTYLLYNALLPLAWADEFQGWPMLNFFKSIAYIVHEPYALAVDPGWQLAVDINNVPSKFLDWLAQFVGIPTLTFTNLSNTDKRAEIVDAPGWHRGTLERMVRAARSTLTGNKSVFVYERYDPDFAGQDRAYHITFITYASETPDGAATLAALIAAKPGGIQLDLLSRAGQLWLWLRDHFPPTTSRTWANAKSTYSDWEHARDVTYFS